MVKAEVKVGNSESPVKKVAKKGGKIKDPNAPKRAMSAFFFWMQDNRDRIKKPGMGVVDVARAAGVEWGKLTDKSEWEEKSAADKKRYEMEMSRQRENSTVPIAPKRAMSAFFFWMRENRGRIKTPGMGVADVTKAAGIEWGLVDKSKWEEMAAEDKKRYETELAIYKEKIN